MSLSHFHTTMLTTNGCMHNPVFVLFITQCIPYLTHFYSIKPDPTNKSAAAHFMARQPNCPNKCSTHPQ